MSMKLALAQMALTQDVDTNYRHALHYLALAASEGADLILFPEVQLSPFFPQYPGSASPLDVESYVVTEDSPYLKGFQDACREHGIFASPNFYVEENGKRYDMSFLIDDTGAICGRQKMVHVAECENFYEQSYYTPSEEGFGVFETKLGKIGIVVCFDRHYPESIRTEALRGADLILIPTANTTSEPADLFRWEVRVQAFQNSVNLAMCNRVGREDRIVFSGDSLVTNYRGELCGVAGEDECLLLTDVDLPAAAAARASGSYATLRRPELYE